MGDTGDGLGPGPSPWLRWQGPCTGESQSLTRAQAIGFRTGSSRPSVMGRGGCHSRGPPGEEVGI